MTIDYEKVLKNAGSKDTTAELVVKDTSNVKPLDFDITIVKSELGIEKVADIVKQAEGYVVETDAEAYKGVSMALSARKQGKDITKLRKELTEPALRFQKEAIKIEKEFTDQLSQVESDLFEKVEIYQEQRKATLKANGIIDESFENLKLELGSSTTKTYYEYKTIDENAVPRQYLRLDTKKIQEDIKDGIREIPGLDIYEVKKKTYRLNGRKK